MSSLISRISRSSVSRAGRGAPPVVVTVRLESARIAETWRSTWSAVRASPTGSVSSSVIVRPSRSAEPARDVIFGQLLAWVREDLERVAHLHEMSGAILGQGEERRPIADPRSLLHVVGHDHDRDR